MIVDGDVAASHGFRSADLLDRLGDDLGGLRIAVPDDFFFAEADAAVAEAVLAAAKVLEGQGARLVSASIAGAAEVQSYQMPVLIADAANLHRDRLATAPDRFSPGFSRGLRPASR